MPSWRRQIVSNQLYELEIRARSRLPFIALFIVRLLLASAMARAQRDCKVVICHFIWMGNHLHLLFIAKDAQQCVNFYAELMKKITDYFKKLLGLSRLELWEPGGPVLSQVLDLEGALSRVAYLYSNPSRAHLVASIFDYPGFSSWAAFRDNPEGEEVLEEVPWVRQPTISVLPSRTLTDKQDKFFTEKLKAKNGRYIHPLIISPNAFYEVFKVYDKEEIYRCDQVIFAEIKEREARYAALRQKEGKKVLGVCRLRSLPIMKTHTPKKDPSDRKVLFHTTSKKLAIAFLENFKLFCEACRKAYRAWKAGDYTVCWPPGAFRPPLLPVASLL